MIVSRQLRWGFAILYVVFMLMLFGHFSHYSYHNLGWASKAGTSVDVATGTTPNELVYDEPHKSSSSPSAQGSPWLGHSPIDSGSATGPASSSEVATVDHDLPTTDHSLAAPVDHSLATAHQDATYPAPPTTTPKPSTDVALSPNDNIDWSRFAYTQYVTDHDYLCNSVMLLSSLYKLGAKADLVMMYPIDMLPDPEIPTEVEGTSEEGRLLLKARDEYSIKLIPVEIQHKELEDATWADSYTKLLAFNQTQYDRVLSLDSDGLVLQPMDELFLLPPAPFAAPRAYWLLDNDPPEKVLSSQVMLLRPSAAEFRRVADRIDRAADGEFDMEIVNQLYLDAALVLPHRPYDMLTGELRRANHGPYLGSDEEPWDPVAAYNEAKYVHFSDWPAPKPWIAMEESVRLDAQPDCVARGDGTEDCVERDLWNSFYKQFMDLRWEVCNIRGMLRSERYMPWRRR